MGFKTINGKKVFIDDNKRTKSNGRNDESEGMKVGNGTRIPKATIGSAIVKEIGDESADERFFDTGVESVPSIDDKNIRSDLIIRTINMLEVTGDSRFEDEPYVAEILLVPQNKSFSKSRLERIANSAGIETDEVDVQDKILDGSSIRLGDEISGTDPIALVNEINKESLQKSSLVGFFLDNPVNRIGDTGFDRLEEIVSDN